LIRDRKAENEWEGERGINVSEKKKEEEEEEEQKKEKKKRLTRCRGRRTDAAPRRRPCSGAPNPTRNKRRATRRPRRRPRRGEGDEGSSR